MKQQFTLKCLGTGDGWPDAKRGHSSYLYRFGRGAVLVDAGEPVERAWAASGLDWNLADTLVLTHMHSDHVGGLFMLLQGFWLRGRTKALDIHLPKGAVRPLRNMLQAVFFFDQLLPFRLRLLPLKGRLKVAGVQVTPFANSHLDRLRARFPGQADFSCYSLLLESGGKRVVHSSDIGKPEDLIPLLNQPVDLLLCELAHLDPKALFAVLQGRQIRQIVFTHLSTENQRKLASIRRLAARMLRDVPHRFALEGEEIQF